jgi:hypothetical protein
VQSDRSCRVLEYGLKIVVYYFERIEIDMYRLLKLLASQNWLRFGIRDRVIRMCCSPDTTISTEFVTDFSA